MSLRAVILLACALACAALCGACASADAESDLPWNATQPWETTPAGMGVFNNY
jgi:hypothetical protein